MSETAQWIIVGAALVAAVVATVRFFVKSGASGCEGCELKKTCRKSDLTKSCTKNRHEILQNKK